MLSGTFTLSDPRRYCEVVETSKQSTAQVLQRLTQAVGVRWCTGRHGYPFSPTARSLPTSSSADVFCSRVRFLPHPCACAVHLDDDQCSCQGLSQSHFFATWLNVREQHFGSRRRTPKSQEKGEVQSSRCFEKLEERDCSFWFV